MTQDQRDRISVDWEAIEQVLPHKIGCTGDLKLLESIKQILSQNETILLKNCDVVSDLKHLITNIKDKSDDKIQAQIIEAVKNGCEHIKGSDAKIMSTPNTSILHLPLQSIPHLKTDNWAEWNSLVLDLLSTCHLAKEILTGEVKEGDTEYSSEIDKDLFIFLQIILPSDLRVEVREVKRRVGLKGSAAYQAMIKKIRDPYQVYVQKTITAGQDCKSLQTYYEHMRFIFWDAEDTGIVYTAQEQLKHFVKGLRCKEDRFIIEMIVGVGYDEVDLTIKQAFRLLSDLRNGLHFTDIYLSLGLQGEIEASVLCELQEYAALIY